MTGLFLSRGLLACAVSVISLSHAVPARADDCSSRTEVFYWSVPDDVFALTHGGHTAIDLVPEKMTTLEGTPVQKQLFVGTFVRNEAGEIVGIGSELEEFAQPMTAASTHDTSWTLLIKDRGTIFAHEIEDVNAETQTFFQKIADKNEPWTGSYETLATIGPAANGLGFIIGGTGEFAGATGYMKEENHYKKIDGLNYEVRNRLTFYFCE